MPDLFTEKVKELEKIMFEKGRLICRTEVNTSTGTYRIGRLPLRADGNSVDTVFMNGTVDSIDEDIDKAKKLRVAGTKKYYLIVDGYSDKGYRQYYEQVEHPSEGVGRSRRKARQIW